MNNMVDIKVLPLALLIVEDSELDYEMLLATLERGGLKIDSVRVETEAEMRAALGARTWDAVISDHNLPQFSSTGALTALKSTGLDLPFIIVSGDIGEDVAVEAMRNGADDYLIKGRLKRLPSALGNAIAAAQNRAERKRAETALARSEHQLRQLARHLDHVKENERARLAVELHDRIGTDLAAAQFLISHLRRQVESASTDNANLIARLVEVESLLVTAGKACSEITQDLRPALLDAGPVAAIEWLVTSFGKAHQLDTHFESNREELKLDAESKIAVFRFVEEALDNIVKHANASRIECIVFIDHGNVTIEVSDNGTGMQRAALDRTGKFGLLEVRARLAALAGELDVSSRANSDRVADITKETADAAATKNSKSMKGTTVMLTLPLKSDEAGT
jgi:signal transduction histidine kinase